MPKTRPVTWGRARRTGTHADRRAVALREREAFWSTETTKRDKEMVSLQKALRDLEREHRAAKRQEVRLWRVRACLVERERELRDLARRTEARLEDRTRKMAVPRVRFRTLERTTGVVPIEDEVGAGEGDYHHSPKGWTDTGETERKTGERKGIGGSQGRIGDKSKERGFCRLM